MQPRLENALFFVLRLIGVTVTDTDLFPAMGDETRDRASPLGDLTPLELIKVSEAGSTCVIVSLGVSPAAFRARTSNRDQGEERCSNSLQSS